MAKKKLNPPAGLSPAALEEWQRVMSWDKTIKKCEIKEIDEALLAAYCESVAIFKEAQSEYQKSKLIMRREDGRIIENPYVAIIQKASRDISRYAEQLCFTPSSRAKRKIKEEKVSALEKVFDEIKQFQDGV